MIVSIMTNQAACPAGYTDYRKITNFSDARNFAVIHLKSNKVKRPYLKEFCQKHANGIVNSENPDQTAPLGAV